MAHLETLLLPIDHLSKFIAAVALYVSPSNINSSIVEGVVNVFSTPLFLGLFIFYKNDARVLVPLCYTDSIYSFSTLFLRNIWTLNWTMQSPVLLTYIIVFVFPEKGSLLK